MDVGELLTQVVFWVVLIGLGSIVLWVPALVQGVHLLVRDRRSRLLLVLLTLGLALAALVLQGGGALLEEQELQWRDTVADKLRVLMVLLFGAALVVIGRRTVARLSRTWTKWAVRVCAVLCLMALMVWGFLYIGLLARPETIGTINGQKLVMQKLAWLDTSYTYYAYHDPFVIEEQAVGQSLEPWQEIHWDKTD